MIPKQEQYLGDIEPTLNKSDVNDFGLYFDGIEELESLAGKTVIFTFPTNLVTVPTDHEWRLCAEVYESEDDA